MDKFTLASLNKCAVLKVIRDARAINKAEIARLTNLSIPTAMKITDRLVEQGIVRSCGKHESAGGKRPEMYEFAGEDFFTVGIDIAPTNLKIIVMDLTGKILAKENYSTKLQKPETVIETISRLVECALQKSGISVMQILGAGIGMPGILDLEQGNVIFSPNFHWENIGLREPLRAELLKKTGASWNLYLENSNRALALGEQYFGSGVGYEYFICINLGYGIGSAIVQNGEFYVGSSGTSGEVGHITVEKDGTMCTCGNSGCLEALASGRAIAQQARNLVAGGIKTQMIELVNGDVQRIEAKTVFEAARQGDAAALDIVRKASEYIGIGLASYINLLDPEKIILAGGMANERMLVEQIQRVSKVRRMRFAGRKVKIQVSKLGAYATAMGAASIPLQQLLKQGGLSAIKEQEEPV